ncbi:glycosyltransferase [Xanthomonas hortorum pv. pelargonii]|nr:glycosyltransferase [Xanthomonas hortorum pv. pelargonii]
MVGPQPTDRSGIAEYAAGLVDMLRDCGLSVETVTVADVEQKGASQIVASLRAADAVVYQMGNHPTFHGWMLPLMAAVPGIVHLHDLVLHHMAAGVLSDAGRLDSASYGGLLEKWHSTSQVRAATVALRIGTPIWSRAQVVDYPLHQVATQYATEMVVHSRYSADRIAKDFPWLPITVVPQLYPIVAPHRVRGRLNTIALLGGGQVNRRFDWVVQALAMIDEVLDEPLTLEIAGDVEPAVASQLEALTGLRNVRLINHGRVDDENFWKVFERADLMIALRQPTMGEASAVVSKAMQAGLPTIVSDHGWYAELPGCVKKIVPDNDCVIALAELLPHLAQYPESYARWAEECADSAGRPSLAPIAAAEQYARLLRTHRVFSDFRDRVADAIASMRVDANSPLGSELQRIDVRAGLRGDRWVDAALAVLDDQKLDSHARITGETVGPYPYTEPLPDTAFQGSAAVVDADISVVEASNVIPLRVQLTNEGDFPWLSPSDHTIKPFGIYLGYFWHSSDPSLEQVEQARHFLEDVVRPSSSGIHEIIIRAPDVPGEYQLEIDLVQESVCWFKYKGFTPARASVQVEAASP